MSENFGRLAAAALGAIALVGACAIPASAATGVTNAQFTLNNVGTLDLLVQPTADLGSEGTNKASITGNLGSVVVSDARNSTEEWQMSAESTTFDHMSGTAASPGVSYSSNLAMRSGAGYPISAGDVVLVAGGAPLGPQVVAITESVSGDNSAFFSPRLTVTLPAVAPAGVYIGQVTTSVL